MSKEVKFRLKNEHFEAKTNTKSRLYCSELVYTLLARTFAVSHRFDHWARSGAVRDYSASETGQTGLNGEGASHCLPKCILLVHIPARPLGGAVCRDGAHPLRMRMGLEVSESVSHGIYIVQQLSHFLEIFLSVDKV